MAIKTKRSSASNAYGYQDESNTIFSGYGFDANGNPTILDPDGAVQLTVTTSGVDSAVFSVTDFNATKDADNPVFTFIGDTNTGVGSSGADTLDLTAGGTKTATITNGAVAIAGTLAVSGNATVGGTLGVTGVLTAPGALSSTGVPYVKSTAATVVEMVYEVATLTSAAAGTAIHILPAARVTGSRKFYLQGFILTVSGATPWTDSTGTIVTIQDTAGSPVVLATAAKAQLTSNATLFPASTGITPGTPFRTGVGATAAKGIDIVADHDFAAGSDIIVTIFGIIK